MPPKVSRASTVRATPFKKTTVSSSKSTNKSSSTTSSKSTVSRPTTSAVRSAPSKPAPAPAQKPRNVDRVDFGKPKPPVDAGVYKPAPPKPSKAELERIAREEERAAARAQLPGLIKKANEAYENLQKAQDEVRLCQHDLMREQKKAENSSAWENSKTVLKGIRDGAAEGFVTGKIIASQIPPTDPATTEMLDVVIPMAGTGIGALEGGTYAAKAVSNEDAINEARGQLHNAKEEAAVCDGVFRKCDRDLMDCLTRATKQGPLPSSIDYPTDMATLRRDFNL